MEKVHRSSEEKEKAWGQICPPWVLKGPKSAGLNRVKMSNLSCDFQKYLS